MKPKDDHDGADVMGATSMWIGKFSEVDLVVSLGYLLGELCQVHIVLPPW